MNGVLSIELIWGIHLGDLLKLILLVIYSAAVLLGVRKHSKKRTRLIKILCAACAAMGIIQTLMRFAAPGNGLYRGLDYPCTSFVGFWAGVYIGAGRQAEKFFSYAARRTNLHFLMMALYVALCDMPGRTGSGILSYTDEIGLSRYLPAMSAGITLVLVVMAINAVSYALKERFSVKPVCCYAVFTGVLLPFYAITAFRQKYSVWA